MKKVGVIVLCGNRFQELFWKSYTSATAGYPHDLIMVHRNFLGVPDEVKNKEGNLILENKIINGEDVPHRAFGAYRHFFYKHRDDYEHFIFISDDVVIKRDGWLKKIIDTLDAHEKIGFGASQIFNGHKKYPHPSHLRAPFWFAKTEVLNQIDWQFEHDHDGEERIGDQCASVGYVGVQVGNKIDLAYDATEPYHITQLLEQKYHPEFHPFEKYNEHSPDMFYFYLTRLNEGEIFNETIVSPYSHIGEQNVFIDIEPFHGLIYHTSLDTAKKYSLVEEYPFNINLLCPSLLK